MISRRPSWPALLLAAMTLGVAAGQLRALASQPSEFERLMAAGRSAFDTSKFDEAQAAFAQALAVARAAHREPDEGSALLALSEVGFISSRYDEGKEAATRALDIAERLNDVEMRGRARYYLGLVADRFGQAADALKLYEDAVADLTVAGDTKLLSMALLELISAASDHPVKQPERLQQALSLARQTGEASRVGRVLHLWGDRLFTVGENEAALEKYEQAAAAFAAGNVSDQAGTVYNSIGRLYRRHEQFETALEYQKRALSLHEKSGVPFLHMQSLNAVGVTLQTLGRYRDSRPYLERALAMARESKNTRAEDFVAANLTSTLLADGEYERAARLLEGVTERKLDIYPSIRYFNLAVAYVELGQLDKAMAAANQAIATCGERTDLNCIDGLSIRARVQLARHDRAAALADLENGLTQLEEVRKRLIPADFFKQQFGRSLLNMFSHTIELQLADGRAREALATAEQARARAFLDLLASQNIATTNGTGSGNAPDLRSNSIAPAPKADDLAAIAARLQSTVLLYWVTPERLHIWTVKPDGRIDATSVVVRESHLADLVATTSALGGPQTRANQAAWRSLYDLLIKPVRNQLPATPGAMVTIVPHGPLMMLSFAALQDQRARYLLEDYTLHYVPAAGVLQFTETRRHPSTAAATTLVIADPQLPHRSRLERPLLALPGARLEARAIAQLAPRNSVVTLEGAAANEAAVRTTIAGKHVIHFATHAIVSDTEPFASFLALAQSDATPQKDGTLTAQEIYGLKLQADLVVLSACRSGGGRVTGDGFSTFARAFLYAGAPSLITSVWDVADESTSHLIPEFYRAWRSGASKARALRTAQLKFLNDLRHGTLRVDTAAGLVSLPEHPALWAGFTLIGEPD